jgi:hypothetical protein
MDKYQEYKEKYKKELSFLNEKIKPLILNEGHGDGFFHITKNGEDVIFNFFFLMDYLPFIRFIYRNEKFYNFNNEEHLEMNKLFLNYL